MKKRGGIFKPFISLKYCLIILFIVKLRGVIKWYWEKMYGYLGPYGKYEKILMMGESLKER